MVKTHYDNLKVLRTAPPEIIKAAYKTLAQKYHPDLNPGSEKAARIMVMLNQAYAVLSHPVRRAEHDEWIAEQERAHVDPPKRKPAAPPPQPPAPPPYVAPSPNPQQPTYFSPQGGLIPDPKKARGIWWLRFCRWVSGLLLGFDLFGWIDAIYRAGGLAQYFSLVPAVVFGLSVGWTWILWYAFNEFRRRINNKHTLGYGYPHPSMGGRWSL